MVVILFKKMVVSDVALCVGDQLRMKIEMEQIEMEIDRKRDRIDGDKDRQNR